MILQSSYHWMELNTCTTEIEKPPEWKVFLLTAQ